ncbi:uncharacterized protein DS421_5g166110 [Arachis hypogaea]|nr:uncharacterized protein DS421_5g166110 [Arachis hypogaea]
MENIGQQQANTEDNLTTTLQRNQINSTKETQNYKVVSTTKSNQVMVHTQQKTKTLKHEWLWISWKTTVFIEIPNAETKSKIPKPGVLDIATVQCTNYPGKEHK